MKRERKLVVPSVCVLRTTARSLLAGQVLRGQRTLPRLSYEPSSRDFLKLPICALLLVCRVPSSQLMLNMSEPSGVRRKLSESAWLSPLQELDDTDVGELEDGPDFVFARRCLVYCDLFTVSESEKR